MYDCSYIKPNHDCTGEMFINMCHLNVRSICDRWVCAIGGSRCAKERSLVRAIIDLWRILKLNPALLRCRQSCTKYQRCLVSAALTTDSAGANQQSSVSAGRSIYSANRRSSATCTLIGRLFLSSRPMHSKHGELTSMN